jgi:hypothetical protein
MKVESHVSVRESSDHGVHRQSLDLSITSCRAAIRFPSKQAPTVACRACDPRPSEWMRLLDCSPTRYGGAKYLNNQTLRPNTQEDQSQTTNLEPGPSPILVVSPFSSILSLASFDAQSCFANARHVACSARACGIHRCLNSAKQRPTGNADAHKNAG